MRTFPSVPVVPTLLRVLLAAGATAAAACPAAAQVTTSQRALDALGSGRHAPAPHAAPHHHAPAHAAHAPSRVVAKGPAARPARAPGGHAPTIPAAPPPPPVFRAPVINVPLHPPPPPPPVPVVQTATGTATSIPDGTRISFGAGSADLNPATMQALHDFSDRLKADPQARADIDAISSGTPDDPSTPRRNALSRGLAARAVLINDGIPSTRIYVRVLGQVPAGADASAPPDRVDMRLSQAPGTDTPPAPATGAPGP
jgi:outer membrane protein OmpA-like peptidoglycan-associated protein